MRSILLNPRFWLAGFFFAISLMVIVPAPKIPLWWIAILATEYGHWFVVVVLGILAWEIAISARHANPIVVALCFVAAGLFLKPLIQATVIARNLPAQLAATWPENNGAKTSKPAPLNYGELWLGRKNAGIQEQSLTFTTTDDHALALRLYRDETSGPRPCVLMIHGGGWNSGDARQLEAWNRQLAWAGYRVASIDYRLAPQFHWPAPKEDVAAALAYLKAHASELEIDPTQFVLLGRSAGGQIALTCAYAFHDPAIRGCIASYAPTDMVFAYDTSDEDDILHSRPLIRAFMGGPPAQEKEKYRDASPRELVSYDSPPTLLIHGTRDELVWVRHAMRLRDRLVEAKRPVFFLELPWATHGFDVNPHGPGGQLERYAILWFLEVTFHVEKPAPPL